METSQVVTRNARVLFGVFPWGTAGVLGSLYDMAGNVGEWVHDWDQQYQNVLGVSTDPWGAASGSFRVVRGGSWIDLPYKIRAAARDSRNPAGWYYYIGFRPARTH